MDNITWFKFRPASWIMGKIQRCPEVTQARFMRLCCVYWNKQCDMTIEDAEIEVDKEHLDTMLRFKIVLNVEGKTAISFLDEQILEIKGTSIKNSENAKKRWGNFKEDIPKEEKTPKIENPKAEIDFIKLLAFINLTFGREFKLIDEATRKKYRARLKAGYVNGDIKKAIEAVKADKFHADQNYQYATPEYFSRSKTLEKYCSKSTVTAKAQTTLTLGRHES